MRRWMWLKLLAVLAAAVTIAPAIYAQQTGPGGAPGSGGAASTAALNAANTFTQNQTISTSGTAAIDLVNSDRSVSLSNFNNDWVGLYSNSTGIGLLYFLDSYGTTVGQLAGNERLCWSPVAANSENLGDVGFSRTASGQAALGDCQAGDATGWLELGAIGNGASGSTDLRGHLTLASGSGSYTFTKTYTVAPTCVATDTTTAAAVKVSATTTALTLTGTGEDTLNYICAD